MMANHQQCHGFHVWDDGRAECGTCGITIRLLNYDPADPDNFLIEDSRLLLKHVRARHAGDHVHVHVPGLSDISFDSATLDHLEAEAEAHGGTAPKRHVN